MEAWNVKNTKSHVRWIRSICWSLWNVWYSHYYLIVRNISLYYRCWCLVAFLSSTHLRQICMPLWHWVDWRRIPSLHLCQQVWFPRLHSQEHRPWFPMLRDMFPDFDRRCPSLRSHCNISEWPKPTHHQHSRYFQRPRWRTAKSIHVVIQNRYV